MRNTRRVTTVLADGDAFRTNVAVTDVDSDLSPSANPHHNKSVSATCQRPVTSRSRTYPQRTTFVTILQSERVANMSRLKTRGFVGNRIAKLVTDHSQALCYQVKNAAISALLKHGAASLLSLEPSSRGPVVGLVFAGGGRLHVKPASLDNHAQIKLQVQFASALRSGRYLFGEASNESL